MGTSARLFSLSPIYVLYLAGVYISLKSYLKKKCEGVKKGDLVGFLKSHLFDMLFPYDLLGGN